MTVAELIRLLSDEDGACEVKFEDETYGPLPVRTISLHDSDDGRYVLLER